MALVYQMSQCNYKIHYHIYSGMNRFITSYSIIEVTGSNYVKFCVWFITWYIEGNAYRHIMYMFCSDREVLYVD